MVFWGQLLRTDSLVGYKIYCCIQGFISSQFSYTSMVGMNRFSVGVIVACFCMLLACSDTSPDAYLEESYAVIVNSEMVDDETFTKAIAILSLGIEKHPENVPLRRVRLHYYLTLGEFEKCLADLDVIIQGEAGTPSDAFLSCSLQESLGASWAVLQPCYMAVVAYYPWSGDNELFSQDKNLTFNSVVAELMAKTPKSEQKRQEYITVLETFLKQTQHYEFDEHVIDQAVIMKHMLENFTRERLMEDSWFEVDDGDMGTSSE